MPQKKTPPSPAGDEPGCSPATRNHVRSLERLEYDNTCSGVLRDLSRSVALQRSVSTVSLTVTVRCDAQNASRTNG